MKQNNMAHFADLIANTVWLIFTQPLLWVFALLWFVLFTVQSYATFFPPLLFDVLEWCGRSLTEALFIVVTLTLALNRPIVPSNVLRHLSRYIIHWIGASILVTIVAIILYLIFGVGTLWMIERVSPAYHQLWRNWIQNPNTLGILAGFFASFYARIWFLREMFQAEASSHKKHRSFHPQSATDRFRLWRLLLGYCLLYFLFVTLPFFISEMQEWSTFPRAWATHLQSSHFALAWFNSTWQRGQNSLWHISLLPFFSVLLSLLALFVTQRKISAEVPTRQRVTPTWIIWGGLLLFVWLQFVGINLWGESSSFYQPPSLSQSAQPVYQHNGGGYVRFVGDDLQLFSAAGGGVLYNLGTWLPAWPRPLTSSLSDDRLKGLEISQDGKILLKVNFINPRIINSSVANVSEVEVWDTQKQQLLERIPAEPDSMPTVSTSVDGTCFVLFQHGRVDLHKRQGDTWHAHPLPISPQTQSIALSPDGSLLATAAISEAVQLYQTDTGQLLPQSFRPHLDDREPVPATVNRYDNENAVDSPKQVYHLTFSPDGTLMAMIARHKLYIWRTNNGEVIHTIDLSPEATRYLPPTFSHDNQWLVFGFAGNTQMRCIDMNRAENGVYLFSLKTGRVLRHWKAGVQSASFSYNREYLALTGGFCAIIPPGLATSAYQTQVFDLRDMVDASNSEDHATSGK